MTHSRIRQLLRKGAKATARLLSVGEIIQSGDIVLHDTWAESPSDTSVGQPVADKETILRIELV